MEKSGRHRFCNVPIADRLLVRRFQKLKVLQETTALEEKTEKISVLPSALVGKKVENEFEVQKRMIRKLKSHSRFEEWAAKKSPELSSARTFPVFGRLVIESLRFTFVVDFLLILFFQILFGLR